MQLFRSFLDTIYLLAIACVVCLRLHAQFFIENRGQWDSTLRYVLSNGAVAVRDNGIFSYHNGQWVQLTDAVLTIEPIEQCTTVFNYYQPHSSVEGVRTFRRLSITTTSSQRSIAVESTSIEGRQILPSFPNLSVQHSTQTRMTSWSVGGRFFGSTGRDSIAAMAVAGGNVYVCGWTDSPLLPGSQGQPSGGRDVFVAKFSADGTLIWATRIGGSQDDEAYGIAATTDLVAIVGMTRSANFPITSGTLQQTYGGGATDGFIATFDPATGSRRAATYVGGNQNDHLYSCSIRSGMLAVGGVTSSEGLPVTTHQTVFAGTEDGYLSVVNSQLNSRAWSTYYGGRSADVIRCVSFYPDGGVVIAGTTASINAGSRIADGVVEGFDWVWSADGFIARFSATGMRIWGRYYGSTKEDSIVFCSVTTNDLIIIAGYTNSTNTAQSYIAEAQAAQNNFAGGEWDGFVAVLRPDGTRLWGSYYGGSGSDRCTGAAMDAQGYVLVTGWTTSNDLPLAHSDNTTIAGAADIMIGFFSPDGRRRYASLLYGGTGEDLPIGISYLPDSTIIVVGSTTSGSFSPLDGTNAGALDGFLLRLQSLGILSVPQEEQQEQGSLFRIVGDALYTDIPPECRDASVQVFSLSGQQITRQPVSATTMDIRLPGGVYAIELRCRDQAPKRQLIVVTP